MHIKKIISFLFYFFFISLFFLPFWFKKKFGVVYLDQFIFHLELMIRGKLVADAQVQKSLYKWIFSTSCIGILFYFYIKKKFFNKFNLNKKKETIYFFIIILLSLSYNTAFFQSISFNENDYIAESYVFNDPKNINNKGRNLILI